MWKFGKVRVSLGSDHLSGCTYPLLFICNILFISIDCFIAMKELLYWNETQYSMLLWTEPKHYSSCDLKYEQLP